MQGNWNTKSYKWYQRCFSVNLRDLQKERKRKLVMPYEAWVQIYVVNNVKNYHLAKLDWK